jgi:hypothetical protein
LSNVTSFGKKNKAWNLNAFEMEKEMKREMGKEIIFVCTA